MRNVISRVKRSDLLADLVLFGRRSPVPALDAPGAPRVCSTTQMPVRVIPVTLDKRQADRVERVDDELFALATYISRRELDFLHDEPFIGDFAVVTADLPDGGPVSLLLEIRWSTRRPHTHLSGGRFVGIADTAAV